MRFEKIREEYDAPLAALIRRSLKSARLDVPGTAYYDPELDHLSGYYQRPGREYFLLLEDKKADRRDRYGGIYSSSGLL
jgi:hypothetical protein